MSVEVIGFIAIALGIAGLFLPVPFTIGVFLCTTVLGSAAAIVLPALGNTNISPAHLLLGFVCIRLLGVPGFYPKIGNALYPNRPGFWLVLTAIYGVVTSYAMPRIFAGQTFVFPVRTTGYMSPLAPNTANLTQSIYLVGDAICFLLIYTYADTPRIRKMLGVAALACVTLNLIFAALDLITFWTGTTELFSIIRNANYGLLTDTGLAGFKRIVGSFTEASSFGFATLGYLAFTGRLWLLGVNMRLTGTLSALSLLCLLYSTSATAYVGLLMLLVFVYFDTVLWASRSNVPPRVMWFLFGAPVAAVVVLIGIALHDDTYAYFSNLLDTLVFSKLTSDSGVERSSWNSQGLQNFIDTYGFGVGNGSARASSFPVAVLASFGLIGTVIYALFFITVFFGNTGRKTTDSLDTAFRQSARLACVAWLMASVASGALVDLGLSFFCFAALASAATAPARVRQDNRTGAALAYRY